jgi:acetate CoA/acetoacetate CoA-transferase alpha subunit
MRRAISAAEAAVLIPDGASVMFGGFMGVGTATRVVQALVERGVRGLTSATTRRGPGSGSAG